MIISVRAYSHPHPNPHHIMTTYRRHIMASKQKFGSAHGLVHYKQFIEEYLAAKHRVLELRKLGINISPYEEIGAREE